jgi:hypothetical protein
MLTASVSNTNLLIFSSAAITGVNTNLFYVFDNNVFNTISTYSVDGLVLNATLSKSVNIDGTVKISLYRGGITTAVGLYNTSVVSVTNSTVFEDNTSPSLMEMIEQNNFNFTSYVFSNFITGITSDANFPTANLTLKRRPPTGKITINEGFLGPMQVHRFAALSSTIFSISPFTGSTLARYFAFDFNVFGDTIVSELQILINPTSTFSSTANGYFTINQDYFGNPSQVVLAESSVVSLSTSSSTSFAFTFSTQPTLSEGKYWFIFNPSIGSEFSLGRPLSVNGTAQGNLYTTSLKESEDGVLYVNRANFGAAFTLITERGVVIPSTDTIYNQLDEPQNIPVVYGDQTDLNVFTPLAVPISSHYIQKNILDRQSQIFAVETLIDSTGQNHFEVQGVIRSVSESYYSMISNNLTSNVVRFDFYTPKTLTGLKLISLGDYYTKGSQGKILLSATDFMGISTVQVSTSPEFPESGTTTITLPVPLQKYIDNVDYNFGDLGKKFSTLESAIGYPVKKIFAIVVSGVSGYLIVSDNILGVLANGIFTTVYTLTDSIFTSSTVGTNGILLTDTLGRIYNFSENSVTLVDTVQNIPTASVTQLTNSFIGVSTLRDNSSAQARKRIYKLNDGVLTHQTWSTQIPETQITFIYSTSFGLVIGAFDQIKEVGKIYTYNNSLLTLLYATYLRPDAAYYSSSTSRLYVAFGGSQLLYSAVSNNKLGAFVDTGVALAGELVSEITATKAANSVIVITNYSGYIFNETTFVTIQLSSPGYTADDQQGLLVSAETEDLQLSKNLSTKRTQSYSNVNFDPLLNGLNSSFVYNAKGYIVFAGVSTGISTSFCIQYPSNSAIISATLGGQNISFENNVFSSTFEPDVPKEFSVTIRGIGVTGIGTIALYNGVTTFSPVVGVGSFVAPKTLNWYYRTGGTSDVFGFADGSLREANTTELSSNEYKVYARFTDINGLTTYEEQYAVDSIYNQIQQQQNNQALPSGRILEINPFVTSSNLTQYVPPEGKSNFIYAGTKIVRESGVFESDPYFASDVVAWNQIQVLALIPGATSSGEHGTSVTLYVKTASSLADLNARIYTNSYEVSTINNGNDYSASVTSILANIQSLSGKWIQFKLVLTSATENLTPTVRSVLLTYTGAGKSVFVTKTFDTSIQSTIDPTPLIRRGILTANFVTNGGEIVFGYTTDPNDGNPLNYTVITPNQIFTLPVPSSIIKFGVILKTANSDPCFFDEFGVQLDLGPNDVYFMPPQPAFEIQPYSDPVTGLGITGAYQFVNKTIGIVSSYNWTFGTSYPLGIITYYPANEDAAAGPAANRLNPIVRFRNSGPFTVGLFVTGWVQSNVFFNSELYTKSFIAT